MCDLRVGVPGDDVGNLRTVIVDVRSVRLNRLGRSIDAALGELPLIARLARMLSLIRV